MTLKPLVPVQVADVRDLCTTWNAKNHAHARPGVEERPLGHTDTAVRDTAGNRLTFFTPTYVRDDTRKPEQSS